MISIDDFAKIELKVGTVLEAEEVEGSEKLLKLKVDLGLKDEPTVIPNGSEESLTNVSNHDDSNKLRDSSPPAQNDIRQILAGIKKWYKAEKLIGKQFIFVANLEPRMMMGMESQGMLLCCGDDPSTSLGAGKPVPLKPSQKVPNGSKIR